MPASHFAWVVPRGWSTQACAHLRAATSAACAGGADFGVSGDSVSLVSVTSGLLVSVCSDTDRKSTRLNSSHVKISYAVFCLKKKTYKQQRVQLSSISANAQNPQCFSMPEQNKQ